MNRILTISIFWFIFAFSSVSYAQKAPVTYDQLLPRLSTIRNPFQPQLPEKKPEPKEEPPQEQKPEIDDPIPVPIPKVEIPDKVPDLTVTGIIWKSDRPQAIINGQVVDLGDIISDVQIIEIQKEEIRGTFHDRPITINHKGVNNE